MRSASYTSQFKRDVKLAVKRGKDMGKLRDVIDRGKVTFLIDVDLYPRYRPEGSREDPRQFR